MSTFFGRRGSGRGHQDRVVDEEYEAIQRRSITFMMGSATIPQPCAGCHVGGALRSSAIGVTQEHHEYVIYMVQARTSAHLPDDVERERARGPRAGAAAAPSA